MDDDHCAPGAYYVRGTMTKSLFVGLEEPWCTCTQSADKYQNINRLSADTHKTSFYTMR
jgi:hypothetical protein